MDVDFVGESPSTRWVVIDVNNDNDDRNRVPDNEDVDAVAGEDDLLRVELRFDRQRLTRGVFTWSVVNGAEHVALWLDQERRTRPTRTVWEVTDASMPTALYVEGLSPSQTARDVEFRLLYTETIGKSYWDTLRITVAAVDVDLDSDNNDLLQTPSRTRAEDLAEDIEGDVHFPGKYVVVNHNDDDLDLIPDFADGYDRDGVEPDDDVNANDRFVPMVLHLSDVIDLATAKIKLTYAASDPAGVTRTGQEPEYEYRLPVQGSLRVWMQDGGARRDKRSRAANSSGDYVAPGTYTPEQLGLTPASREKTLYVEAVKASGNVGDQRILVEVDPDGPGPFGFMVKDAVRVTAVKVELRDTADNNRDILGGYIAWIGADPAPRMPQLRAQVLPDLGNGISAEWSMRTEYTDHGRNDEVFVPGGATADAPVVAVISQQWDIGAAMAALPDELRIFGGKAVLKLRAGIAFEYEHQFRIRGGNPDDAIARAYIDNNNRGIWFAYAIARHESRDGDQIYNQFVPEGSVYPRFGPEDKGLPFFSGNPQGWGIMQLDFSAAGGRAATVAEIWDWQRNVVSGMDILEDKQLDAIRWMQSLAPQRDRRGALLVPLRPTGQRHQAQVQAGGGVYQPDPNGDGRFNDAQVVGGAPVGVGNRPVGACFFSDGTPSPIEDAVTMKKYNGATAGEYVAWAGAAWVFHPVNHRGRNYVQEICANEVGQRP